MQILVRNPLLVFPKRREKVKRSAKNKTTKKRIKAPKANGSKK